jgi:hypothetical protein
MNMECIGSSGPQGTLVPQKRRRGIAPLFLHLGTRWRLVISITTWPIYPWHITMVPIEWEVVWPPELVCKIQRGHKYLAAVRIQTLVCLVIA